MADAILFHASRVFCRLGRSCFDCRPAIGFHRRRLADHLPAWDAAANFVDASRNGGLGNNRTQAINVAVSSVMTVAVVVALTMSMNWVLSAFGLWAIFSGVLQLGTALRRWRTSGGQWAIILSGGQSAVAGIFFIAQARMPEPPSIANIAGYAGLGAFYFLVSAVWRSASHMRRKTA